MAESIEVWLDEEAQIVVQRVVGSLDVDGFLRLHELTSECVSRLRDPARVRILVDATRLEPLPLKVRKTAMEKFESNIYKMATFGEGRFTRIIGTFVSMVVGQTRMRQFATEEQARQWLQE